MTIIWDMGRNTLPDLYDLHMLLFLFFSRHLCREQTLSWVSPEDDRVQTGGGWRRRRWEKCIDYSADSESFC